MIYIYLDADGFEYGTKHIVWLFFNEKVTFVNKEMLEEKFFIKLCIKEADNQYSFFCSIYNDGILKVRKSFDKEKYRPNKSDSKTDINLNDRRIKRTNLNRILYLCLSEYTDKKLPWGMLTGIRPVKIYHQIKNRGYNEAQINKTLLEHYCITPKKVNLITEIAKNESSIFETASPKKVSIYIGIPFCRTTCLYCSFTSNPVSKYEDLIDGYLNALKYEIEQFMPIIIKQGYEIQSIYIGGGTPTSISAKQLEFLLETVENIIPFRTVKEYTLEAGRPDSIDKQKLLLIKNSSVDRISINPQTMNDITLKKIGRQHTAYDIIEKFILARELGFTNINMDLIAGLPDEDLNMFEYTLNEVLKLNPDSLTVHTMSIKKASKLYENKDSYSFASQNLIESMIDMSYKRARDNNLNPYYVYRQKNILGNLENIGYSKKGYESIYNIQMMEEEQTIFSFGAGAVSKVWYKEQKKIDRAFNLKDVALYINRINEMIDRKINLLNTDI